MARKSFPDSLAQRFRTLDKDVAQGAKEIWKFTFRATKYILSEQAASRAEFDHVRFDLANPESATSLRIAAPAGVRRRRARRSTCRNHQLCRIAQASRVIAKIWIVETVFHIARKGHRPELANLLLDFLTKKAHDCCWRRSARSCGVRINISTKYRAVRRKAGAGSSTQTGDDRGRADGGRSSRCAPALDSSLKRMMTSTPSPLARAEKFNSGCSYNRNCSRTRSRRVCAISGHWRILGNGRNVAALDK